MSIRTTTGAILILLAVTISPVAVQAQGYAGVVADEDGGGSATPETSVDLGEDRGGDEDTPYNYPAGQGPNDIFKSDYYQKRAALKRANQIDYHAYEQEQRAKVEAARQREAKEDQQAIDARVKAAVSAPSTYGTRIDGLKAPVPPMSTQPAPPTSPTPVVTPTLGGGNGGGGGNIGGGDRGGSVLENMMQQLQ